MMRLTLALLLTAACAIDTQGFVPVAKSFVRSVAVNNMALLVADNEEDATYRKYSIEEETVSVIVAGDLGTVEFGGTTD